MENKEFDLFDIFLLGLRGVSKNLKILDKIGNPCSVVLSKALEEYKDDEGKNDAILSMLARCFIVIESSLKDLCEDKDSSGNDYR